MIFIGTLPSTFQGGTSGITFGIIFGIIMYMLFAKRIYNEEYQNDPFPNMSALLDKYKSYYDGSEENKKRELPDGTFIYNHVKKESTYNHLSKSIDEVKKKLQLAIDKYSEAYKNINDTLELNDDPFSKKLNKAKELKEKMFGKKPNPNLTVEPAILTQNNKKFVNFRKNYYLKHPEMLEATNAETSIQREKNLKKEYNNYKKSHK